MLKAAPARLEHKAVADALMLANAKSAAGIQSLIRNLIVSLFLILAEIREREPAGSNVSSLGSFPKVPHGLRRYKRFAVSKRSLQYYYLPLQNSTTEEILPFEYAPLADPDYWLHLAINE